MGKTFSGASIEGGWPEGVLLPLGTGLFVRVLELCEGPGRCGGMLPPVLPRDPRPRLGSPLKAVWGVVRTAAEETASEEEEESSSSADRGPVPDIFSKDTLRIFRGSAVVERDFWPPV